MTPSAQARTQQPQQFMQAQHSGQLQDSRYSQRPSAVTPCAIALLGASGSIGLQTLEVIRANPERYTLTAIAVHRSIERALKIAQEFAVSRVVIADEAQRNHALIDEFPAQCTVAFGHKAVQELASLDEVDVVLNALVGKAGMRASMQALVANKRLALANKESLVVAGDLIMPQAIAADGIPRLLPVDSEHSAIFQCLYGEDRRDLVSIWLTASGGPFFGWSKGELAGVTRAQALAHPTWSMGSKITIDSATLMNKGLEVIETMHLFNCSVNEITVAVHRQSVIHSMVEFADGSVKAHLGNADMRIPIMYALSYPERLANTWSRPDFFAMNKLTFDRPDLETFRALSLALEAARVRQTMPCVLNAANEVAVAAFLADQIGFNAIAELIEDVMQAHELQAVESLDQLDEVDAWARSLAQQRIMSCYQRS